MFRCVMHNRQIKVEWLEVRITRKVGRKRRDELEAAVSLSNKSHPQWRRHVATAGSNPR